MQDHYSKNGWKNGASIIATNLSCLHVLVEESMYEDFADFQDKGGKGPILCKDEHEMNKSKMCC